ncbi:hypothetical protein K0M31_008192 [Melipona bicolor]|uniref:Uncharacterized protein n=1 Tax=Melipona bicolor TaxID=60889 RepID=A0AA40FQG8_9HYME|nr:hypothetical protein K0M31_008192 [Melipona bicolor]
MPGDRGYPNKHLIRDYIISKGAMGTPVSASLTKVRIQPPSDNGVPYQPLDNRDFTPQAPTLVLTSLGINLFAKLFIGQICSGLVKTAPSEPPVGLNCGLGKTPIEPTVFNPRRTCSYPDQPPKLAERGGNRGEKKAKRREQRTHRGRGLPSPLYWLALTGGAPKSYHWQPRAEACRPFVTNLGLSFDPTGGRIVEIQRARTRVPNRLGDPKPVCPDQGPP